MLDVHIDDFWNDCAAALLSGMRNFPRPITLFIEDIAGPDNVDEFGLHSPRHLAALGAVQWLKDEGFIRFGSLNRQESVDEFILTGKAFSRLLAPADSKALRDMEGGDSTPIFQVLEFARLQGNAAWCGQLLQHAILQP